jgi:hypothetical protein
MWVYPLDASAASPADLTITINDVARLSLLNNC